MLEYVTVHIHRVTVSKGRKIHSVGREVMILGLNPTHYDLLLTINSVGWDIGSPPL